MSGTSKDDAAPLMPVLLWAQRVQVHCILCGTILLLGLHWLSLNELCICGESACEESAFGANLGDLLYQDA